MPQVGLSVKSAWKLTTSIFSMMSDMLRDLPSLQKKGIVLREYLMRAITKVCIIMQQGHMQVQHCANRWVWKIDFCRECYTNLSEVAATSIDSMLMRPIGTPNAVFEASPQPHRSSALETRSRMTAFLNLGPSRLLSHRGANLSCSCSDCKH